MDQDASAVSTADPTAAGRLYTTSQVAKLIGVSQKTVQLWIRVGTLTAVRYGRVLRIRQEDLASFGEVVNHSPAPAGAQDEPQ
jgi:excisionase family DNA binding protein